MPRGLRAVLTAAALALALPTLAADTLDPAALAGVYKIRFPNALVDGERYTSENILEIVPLSRRTAYVRLHAEFFNGHICSLWGVAEAEGRELVYRPPAEKGGDERCVVRLGVIGQSLKMSATHNWGCQYYCGARGSLDGLTFPTKSKRAIRYLPRLRSSYQYGEALVEYEAQRARR